MPKELYQVREELFRAAEAVIRKGFSTGRRKILLDAVNQYREKYHPQEHAERQELQR